MVILKKFKELKRYETFSPYSMYINIRYEDLDKYATKTDCGWKAEYTLFGRTWFGILTDNYIAFLTERFGRFPDYVSIELVWPSTANGRRLYIVPRWKELDEGCVRLAYYDNTI